MFSLEITIDSSPLIAALSRLPDYLDFRREPMKGAAQNASGTLARWEHNRFITYSGGGGSWPDLAQKTKEARLRKQAKAAGMKVSRYRMAQAIATTVMPMLYVTGALEAGLFDRGATGHFIDFTEDTVTEGVRDGAHPEAPISVGELAVIHHYGSQRRHIPARPVMGEPDEKILGEIQIDLNHGLAAAFDQLTAASTPFAA